MRYFYDTEFIERGAASPLELISIGIVAEDGREYYAQSTHFDTGHASDWVRENVIDHLDKCPSGAGMYEHMIRATYLACVGGCPWAHPFKAAQDIAAFIQASGDEKNDLWGYYADYDHVVLCQLFGTMMQLPKGFPMYTRDLKQWCDQLGNPDLPAQGKGEHHALLDARWNRRVWEFLNEEQGGLTDGR